MMKLGKSKLFPESWKLVTGTDRVNATAVVKYYQPLIEVDFCICTKPTSSRPLFYGPTGTKLGRIVRYLLGSPLIAPPPTRK